MTPLSSLVRLLLLRDLDNPSRAGVCAVFVLARACHTDCRRAGFSVFFVYIPEQLCPSLPMASFTSSQEERLCMDTLQGLVRP